MAKPVKEPKLYTLETPVEMTFRSANSERTETVSVLNFRVPVGRDFRALDKADGKIAMIMAFGAQIADVDELVLDKLDGDDWAAVLEIVTSFLPASLQTGETSSKT